MKDHTECQRQFTQLSRTWYGGTQLPEGEKLEIVIIGFYHPDGGTTGEFQVYWQELGSRLTPKLSAYDDSWSALFQFGDLLESMADIDGEDISPAEFCALLVSLGIKDSTKTEQA